METLQYDPNVLSIDLGSERMSAKGQDIQAEAMWHGIPIEGFTGPGEEMIRSAISRVPPELLKNVHKVKAAPELQPKHGRYDPETHTVNVNPLIFNLRQRFGKGQGWIYHTELCLVHEIGHSIYYFFPEKIKDQWREISGWQIGTGEGQAEPYRETRPGWPKSTSKWTHRKGVGFTRKYARKNDDEDFADSFAFFILSKPHQMAPAKRKFIEDLLNERVQGYPQVSINGPHKPYGERNLQAYGTSEGVTKAWDTRGRGRHEPLPTFHPKTSDTLVIAFGRFNPPHSGHLKVINELQRKAQETGGDAILFVGSKQNNTTDPLSVYDKIKYLKMMAPTSDIHWSPKIGVNAEVLKRYSDMGYKHLVVVDGADREGFYHDMIDSRMKSGDLKFDDWNLSTIPRSETAMSATHQRKAVLDNDYASFLGGLPPNFSPAAAQEMWNRLRANLLTGVQAYGTSEGVTKAWDTRGRGRKLKPRPLPEADPPPPEEGELVGLRTDDGSIYWEKEYSHTTHYSIARSKGIPAERLVGGGWIKDGVYHETEYSEAAHLGERARALMRTGKYLKYDEDYTPFSEYGEDLEAGGPGSGCNPEVAQPRCGRPSEGAVKSWDTPPEQLSVSEQIDKFYHGTISNNLESILKKGLVQSKKQAFKLYDPDLHNYLNTRNGFIYFTGDRHMAEWYAELKQKVAAAEPGEPVATRWMGEEPGTPPTITFMKEGTTPALPGSKPAIVTLEIPQKAEGEFEADPASMPGTAWRKKGKIPAKYLSKIEVLDKGTWKPWWTKQQGRIAEEGMRTVYLVFYGPTAHIALVLSTDDIEAGGPGSGCNPEVAQPRCGRPNSPVRESTRVHESTLPDFGWKPNSRYKKVLDAIKDGKWHSLEGHPSPKTGFYTGMRVNMRKLGYNVVTKRGELRLVRIKKNELIAKPIDSKPEGYQYTIEFPDGPTFSSSSAELRQHHVSEEGIKSTEHNPNMASAVSYVVNFDDGTKGLFKPSSGDLKGLRREISDGYSTEREVGAWEVAKLAGMDDMVAASSKRHVDGADGVLLEWQEGDVASSVGESEGQYDAHVNAQRPAIFDYVIGNQDRHSDNWIVENSGDPENAKLHLIDHNLTFPDKMQLDINHNTYFVDRFLGPGKDLAPLPTDVVNKYLTFEDAILSSLKKIGLPEQSVVNVKERIDHMRKSKNWVELLKPYGYNWGSVV